MTGWDEHGFAVKTGSVLDGYLGQGDLQDAENCGYAPVSVLAELGVDTAHGDPQVQYRDGRIVLLGGAVLERGGTLNCVWAVTKLPDQPEYADETERMQSEADAQAEAAYERGLAEGRAERANTINAMTRSAYEDGVGDGRVEGRRQATEGWEREWAMDLGLKGAPLHPWGSEADARRGAAARVGRTVVSRLVGPWEPDEQHEAAPGCPACHTILNAKAAGCDDPWHADNRPASGGVVEPSPLTAEEAEPVRCTNLPGCPLHPDVTYEVHEVDGCEIRGPRLEAPPTRPRMTDGCGPEHTFTGSCELEDWGARG